MELTVIEILDISAAIKQLNESFEFPLQGGATRYDESSFITHQGKKYILADNFTSILGAAQVINIDVNQVGNSTETRSDNEVGLSHETSPPLTNEMVES